MNELLHEMYKEEIKQYVAWKKYEIGFSGNGTSALDQEPDFPKPNLPKALQEELDEAGELFAKMKRNVFKDVGMLMGEDPDDWS